MKEVLSYNKVNDKSTIVLPPNGIKHSSARRVTRLIRKSAQKSSCVQVRGGHWSGATSSCHSPVFKAEQARTAPGHGCLAWEAAMAEDEN